MKKTHTAALDGNVRALKTMDVLFANHLPRVSG